jgi:hypothetical protein
MARPFHGTFAMASTASRIVSPPAQEQRLPPWYATACDAIESAKCLEIGYQSFARIVEVHRVGIGRAGEHILSGWQIRGPAYERAGWKLLNLDEPVRVTLTDIPSHAPRPDYRRGTRQFIGIICQL